MSYRTFFAVAVFVTGCHSATNSGAADLAMPGSTGPDFAELNTPVMCTSGTMWTSGDHGSSRMHPGAACIDCHDSNFGPSLSFAGTVYPSAHEPDDCNGASGIQVVITDADGIPHTLNTNAAGNFYSTSNYSLPFTAKVVSGGAERAMIAPQMTGDCNSCHTQDGTMDAPGRIVAP
jgi:hypothetical protein